MTIHLDISIGPVQGFVAQSRRTRDLWGSSYLLSFLSAHAMKGAQEAGGKIVRPNVEQDPLFQWMKGEGEGMLPRIGSVPNHFVLEVDEEASRVARAAVESLQKAWERICRVVWEQYVVHACHVGDGTEVIWHRQIKGFWDISWTAGPSTAQGGLLARRKHWRSHCLPDEPGDKCTVMPDLQELSGHVGAAGDREQQERFWNTVRTRLGSLDLQPNERLCAIALVKRLFPKVSGKALGGQVDTSHWPSTAYVAAVPWVRNVIASVPQQARAYADAVQRHERDVLAERHPQFIGLDRQNAGDFAKLDGNYLNREFILNERLCPLLKDTESSARDQLSRLLQCIYQAKDSDGSALGSPPAYYALLLADGDRLGKLVSQLGGMQSGGMKVGKALLAFTGQVQGIVKQHDGITVYAGGDDVLALLAVPKALECAAALSQSYQAAFDSNAAGHDDATLSAAVVFAHVRLPRGAVMTEAHRLLDEVAKDGNGRDSLAVGVLKPGGLNCQWTTTWKRPHSDSGEVSALTTIERLIGSLREHTAEPGLSSGLVYRIRETLAQLCEWDPVAGANGTQWKPGSWISLPPELDIRAHLRAEIYRSLVLRMDKEKEVQERSDQLADCVWDALGRAKATDDKESGNTKAGVDGLLLARFLAHPEHEEADR